MAAFRNIVLIADDLEYVVMVAHFLKRVVITTKICKFCIYFLICISFSLL